jgi:hypothetical protein
MDTLNRIFDIATEEGSLSPLKGRQARLRLSLYADDAVIFTNPKREDINGIMQIMEAFGDATGLRINMEKSTVAPIRCDSVDLDDALRDFAGARVHFLVKYLGLPLTLGRLFFFATLGDLKWYIYSISKIELRGRSRVGRDAWSLWQAEES